jgi:predicted dehydrogenase
MERQCRRWYFYTWICGDHIVEQHVHNLDVVNWALDAMPVSCTGMGGRQTRTAPQYGNVFDHFAVEFNYANGASVMSMCRHSDGCSNNVSERIIGTKGDVYTSGRKGTIKGQNPFEGKDSPNPYLQEHLDLIKSIRNGDGLNEGKRVAKSTMCAIMGRMSAYTGRSMKFDWALNASKLDLMPKKLEFGPLEMRPAAMPGITPLI